MTPPPVADLIEARDLAARSAELLARAVGRLPALEAGAVALLAADLGHVVRKLATVALFIGDDH